jgi:hypothetical protein
VHGGAASKLAFWVQTIGAAQDRRRLSSPCRLYAGGHDCGGEHRLLYITAVPDLPVSGAGRGQAPATFRFSEALSPLSRLLPVTATAQLTRIDAAHRARPVISTGVPSVPQSAVSSVGSLWGAPPRSGPVGFLWGSQDTPPAPAGDYPAAGGASSQDPAIMPSADSALRKTRPARRRFRRRSSNRRFAILECRYRQLVSIHGVSA